MKKILAIDDKKSNLTTISAVIQSYINDCSIYTASSGTEGIKIAKKEQPDIILLDIMMPEMDGYKVCEILKNHEATKNIPIIMLTAIKTDTKNRIKGLNLGADAFLFKPIDSVELIAQINVMLRIKKAEDKLKTEKENIDRKYKEKIIKLHESENKLRLFTESATDNFTLWDADLRLIDINKNALDLFPAGTKREDVIGKHMLELNPNIKKTKRYNNYLNVIKTGTPYNVEEYSPEIKGKKLFLSLKAFKTGDGMGMITSDITERKLTEEALKKSEHDLKTLFNAMTDAVFEIDYNGRYINVAPTSPDLLIKPINELFGSTIADFFEKSEADKLLKLIRDSIDNNNTNITEYPLLMNGKTIWFEARIAPKTANSTIFIARDITHRKKAEQELHNRERVYKTLLNNLPGFTYRCANDKERTMEYISDGCKTITGYLSDDFIHNKIISFNNIIIKEYRDLLWAHWQKVLKERTTFEYEYPIITKTNEIRWVWERGCGIYSNDNKLLYLEGFITDITEKKYSEKLKNVLFNISNIVIKTNNLTDIVQLIQEELSTIIDTTNFYIALYDKKTDTLSLPFFEDEKDKFTSFPADKTLTYHVIKTQKSLLADTSKIKELESRGEIKCVGSNSKLWLGVPLKIKDEITGVLSVQSYTDKNAYDDSTVEMLEFVSEQISISIDRKKAEEEIITALKKAEAGEKLKTAFLLNISHEIRTPMNGILGFADLLKETNLSTEKQEEYVKIIEKSGRRMLNTIDAIMNISKIETGNINCSVSEININNLLTSLYDNFKNFINTETINLSIETTSIKKNLIIYSDYEKLYTILQNLISNAIKYTNKGIITFGYTEKEEYLEFFVKDTGIGIQKEKQETIFEPFIQVNIEDTIIYQGTGLGLTIAKEFIKLLKGKLRLESIENRGSTFSFTLPYKIKEEVPLKLTTSKQKKLKILIVEDDYTISNYLSTITKSISRETLIANTGVKAIDIYKNNTDIDVILMDIKIPLLNGYKTTQKIRELNKDVIIIAQTGFTISENREKAIESGCNDFITKPIKKNDLINMIKGHISKRQNNERLL